MAAAGALYAVDGARDGGGRAGPVGGEDRSESLGSCFVLHGRLLVHGSVYGGSVENLRGIDP